MESEAQTEAPPEANEPAFGPAPDDGYEPAPAEDGYAEYPEGEGTDPDEGYDLSEQEEALQRKLSGEQVLDTLAEPEEEYEPDGEPEPEGAEYGEEGYGYGDRADDPILTHPAVQQLAQENQQLYDHLVAREQREDAEAFDGWYEHHAPTLQDPAMRREVAAIAIDLAERAGDPRLRFDPVYLDLALAKTQRDRATPAEVPADKARHQGAPLETEAGASPSRSEPSYEDQAWAEIKAAGGTAFG